MPQISIIKLSDIKKAGRFDAEYFKPEYLEIEKKLEKIGSIDLEYEINFFSTGANLLQYNLKNKENEVLFFRTQHIREIFIDENNLTTIKNQKNYLSLKKGDLLFTRVGAGVGNNTVIPSTYTNNTISDNIICLRLKLLNPFFVSVFLNCKFGKLFLSRTQKGTARGLISRENFNGVLIPLFKNLDKFCEEAVERYYFLQNQSKELYKQAEQILLKELDLINFEPKAQLTFTITKKEVDEAKRFDAEYFQPKYKRIIEKIENYKGGFCETREIINWKKGVEVGSDEYLDEGLDFGRVSDFSKFGFDKITKKISEKLFDELKVKFQPREDEILFTKDGTIGISYLLKEDFEGILSSAFLRLTLKEKYKNFKKECLTLILNSILCKTQVEKLSGGALIAHLKPSDFERFKFPLISQNIQNQIAEKIELSHNLRKESKELLEQAKRKVEQEIENAAY